MEKQKFRIEKDRLYTDDGQVYQLTLISEEKPEPVKAKYPKILEFKTENTNCILRINKDGAYYSTTNVFGSDYTHDQLLTAHPGIESGRVLIWTVAKNENEVFKVGDLTNKGKILRFEYKYGDIMILTFLNSIDFCSFDGLERQKQPILITEDGVEIHDENTNLHGLIPALGWNEFTKRAIDIKESKAKLYFSTYKARESYVKENKPTYSKKQIKEAIKKSSMVLLSRDEYLRLNELNYISEKELIKTLDL